MNCTVYIACSVRVYICNYATVLPVGSTYLEAPKLWRDMVTTLSFEVV